VCRRRNQSAVAEWSQCDHVGGSHPPEKEHPQQFSASLLQHLADEDVDEHHAFEVGAVLGKTDLAVRITAAEHARGATVTFYLALSRVEKSAEHLDEVGTLERSLHHDHAQRDAAQTRN